MRRGLMAWDPGEIPAGVLHQRIQRLQAAMAKAGQDAMILYTNFIRSGAVSHLTAFSPYWADGMLLVPGQGEPLFATTLSKRVGSWIQTVKPVGDLVNSPAPGAVIGKRLAEDGNVRRVAILELDDFPSGLYDELVSALPDVEIVDGCESFAEARHHLDAVERRLLHHADEIAHDALESLDLTPAISAGDAVGAVEKYARLKGAEEVYVAIAPDLDADRRFLRLSGGALLGGRFAIRATVAYKGVWVRRVKTYASGEKDRFAVGRANAWFRDFLSGIDTARNIAAQISPALTRLPGARLADWMAEAPVGTRPLAVIASAASHGDSCVHAAPIMTVGLTIDGVPWCGAGAAVPASGTPG